MSFATSVQPEITDLLAGEVIKSSPHGVSAFEQFEDGLREGRFVKFDTGSVDNLDGSGSPTVIGIAKRKLTGEIGEGTYTTSGLGADDVAEVITFGYATVTVTDAADPSKYDPVYVINANNANAGKATEDSSGNLAVSDVVFWEPKGANTWLVRINKHL